MFTIKQIINGLKMSFNVYFDSYDFIRRAQVSSSIESYPDEIKQVLAKLKKDFESVSRNDLEGYLMFLSKKSGGSGLKDGWINVDRISENENTVLETIKDKLKLWNRSGNISVDTIIGYVETKQETQEELTELDKENKIREVEEWYKKMKDKDTNSLILGLKNSTILNIKGAKTKQELEQVMKDFNSKSRIMGTRQTQQAKTQLQGQEKVKIKHKKIETSIGTLKTDKGYVIKSGNWLSDLREIEGLSGLEFIKSEDINLDLIFPGDIIKLNENNEITLTRGEKIYIVGNLKKVTASGQEGSKSKDSSAKQEQAKPQLEPQSQPQPRQPVTPPQGRGGDADVPKQQATNDTIKVSQIGISDEREENEVVSFLGIKIPKKEYKILQKFINGKGELKGKEWDDLTIAFPGLSKNVEALKKYLPKLSLLNEIIEITISNVLTQIDSEWKFIGMNDNKPEAQRIIDEINGLNDILKYLNNPENIETNITEIITRLKELEGIKNLDSTDNLDEILKIFSETNNNNLKDNRLRILDLFRVGFVTKGNSEMVKYALQKDILEISDFKKIKALLSEPPEKLIGIAKNFATKDDESIMEMFGFANKNSVTKVREEFLKKIKKTENIEYIDTLREEIKKQNPNISRENLEEELRKWLDIGRAKYLQQVILGVAIDEKVAEIYKTSKDETVKMYANINGEGWAFSDRTADFSGDLIPDLLISLVPMGAGLTAASLLLRGANKARLINNIGKVGEGASALRRFGAGVADVGKTSVIGGTGFYGASHLVENILYQDSPTKVLNGYNLSDWGKSAFIFGLLGTFSKAISAVEKGPLGKHLGTKINKLPKGKTAINVTYELTKIGLEAGLLVGGDRLFDSMLTDKEVQDITLEEFIQAFVMVALFKKFGPKEEKPIVENYTTNGATSLLEGGTGRRVTQPTGTASSQKGTHSEVSKTSKLFVHRRTEIEYELREDGFYYNTKTGKKASNLKFENLRPKASTPGATSTTSRENGQPKSRKSAKESSQRQSSEPSESLTPYEQARFIEILSKKLKIGNVKLTNNSGETLMISKEGTKYKIGDDTELLTYQKLLYKINDNFRQKLINEATNFKAISEGLKEGDKIEVKVTGKDFTGKWEIGKDKDGIYMKGKIDGAEHIYRDNNLNQKQKIEKVLKMKEVREEVLKKRFEKKADITDSPELRDSIREVITLNKRFANFSDKKLVQGAWNFMSQELRVTGVDGILKIPANLVRLPAINLRKVLDVWGLKDGNGFHYNGKDPFLMKLWKSIKIAVTSSSQPFETKLQTISTLFVMGAVGFATYLEIKRENPSTNFETIRKATWFYIKHMNITFPFEIGGFIKDFLFNEENPKNNKK